MNIIKAPFIEIPLKRLRMILFLAIFEIYSCNFGNENSQIRKGLLKNYVKDQSPTNAGK